MSKLASQIKDLAAAFVDQVVDSIRNTSLEELIGNSAARRIQGPGAVAAAAVPAARTGRGGKAAAAPRGGRATVAKAAKTTASGRLGRRSAEEIARTLGKIVGVLKEHADGLRAEEIRSLLGMQAKEMPRILKEGLATRALRSKGQKRATTYFAK